MVIERTEKGILIKTTIATDTKDVQRIIDYFTLKELISKNQGAIEDADSMAREAEEKWWQENKHSFS